MRLPIEKVKNVTIQAEELLMQGQALTSENKTIESSDLHPFIEGIKELNQELSEMRFIPIKSLFHHLILEARSLSKELEEKIVSFKPDVVLLDLRMPKKDGLEVTGWVMSKHPTPVTAWSLQF